MMKLSVASAWKSGSYAPVLNDTAVLTAEGRRSRMVASASFRVSPESQVSSTTRTLRPRTEGGGAGSFSLPAESRISSSVMGLWKRLLGRSRSEELLPQRLDYLNEPLALERQGDYEAALTSYRLALRDPPADLRVLQNMAIAYTQTHRVHEA